jgi:hypothetical protein
MIDDDNIALPARTGPDRLLSPLERLAETSEAETWLQKQKSAPLEIWRLSWTSSISSSSVGNDFQEPFGNEALRHFQMSSISSPYGGPASLNVAGRPRPRGLGDRGKRSVVLCVRE